MTVKDPQRFLGIRDFPYLELKIRDFPHLKLGMRDFKAKSGRVSALKICLESGMTKITLGIARNFGSRLRD